MPIYSLIKALIPDVFFQWLKRNKYKRIIRSESRYQEDLLLHFSSTFRDDLASNLSLLMIESHVLEKGITMPGRRLGFGTPRVLDIIDKCNCIIKEWGAEYVEVQSALANLKQYLDIHEEAKFHLNDDIVNKIKGLLPYLTYLDENCYSVERRSFFKHYSDFKDFAESRHSVRWYSDTAIDEEKLLSAIKLAQTSPSACNRQSTRVKVILNQDKKKYCSEIQNGNRGFGESAGAWLLITSELRDWDHQFPFAPYIDGGIFAMNLLYALHYYGFVACPLNAHLSKEKKLALQRELGYPETETPVMFITIGNAPESFMVPKSRRLRIEDVIQTI